MHYVHPSGEGPNSLKLQWREKHELLPSLQPEQKSHCNSSLQSDDYQRQLVGLLTSQEHQWSDIFFYKTH